MKSICRSIPSSVLLHRFHPAAKTETDKKALSQEIEKGKDFEAMKRLRGIVIVEGQFDPPAFAEILIWPMPWRSNP